MARVFIPTIVNITMTEPTVDIPNQWVRAGGDLALCKYHLGEVMDDQLNGRRVKNRCIQVIFAAFGVY